MHVKRISITDFKNVEKFEQDFNGANLYFFMGDNATGKTSLLDSILIALEGTTKKAGELLRQGKEKGYSSVQVGKYIISYTFTKKNPKGYLEIRDEETGMTSDKVSFLQNIIGYTHIDPIKFAQMSDYAEGRRKQVEIVKNLLDDESRKKIEELDNDIEATKQQYRDTNTLLKNEKIPEIPEQAPEPVDYDKELQKYKEAKKYLDEKKNLEKRQDEINNTRTADKQIKAVRDKYRKQTAEIDKEIEELQRLIKDKQNKKEQLESQEAQEVDQITENQENLSDELDNIRERLDEINNMDLSAGDDNYLTKVQQKRDEYKEYQEAVNKKEYIQGLREKLKQIKENGEKLRRDKNYVISQSDLPIENLSFNEEGLTLNGIRVGVDQTSTSENMELAVRLAIASNSGAKVFLVSQGESLGKDAIKRLAEIADKYNFQGFIEYRDNSDEIKVEQYFEK